MGQGQKQAQGQTLGHGQTQGSKRDLYILIIVARGQGGEQSGLALATGAWRQGRLIVAQTPDAI